MRNEDVEVGLLGKACRVCLQQVYIFGSVTSHESEFIKWVNLGKHQVRCIEDQVYEKYRWAEVARQLRSQEPAASTDRQSWPFRCYEDPVPSTGKTELACQVWCENSGSGK